MLMDLIARIKLFTGDYEAGLKRVERATEQTGQRIVTGMKSKLAAAFSAAAITAAARSMARFAEEIHVMSQRADVGAEDMQRLNFVAASTGVRMESVANAFKDLAKARLEAMRDPSGRKGSAFSAIGISQAELEQTTEMLGLFSKAQSQIKSTDLGARKLAIVQELFGEGGVQMLPLLNSEMDKLLSRFESFGGPMAASQIESMARMNGELRQMGIIAKQITAPALESAAGAVNFWGRALARVATFGQLKGFSSFGVRGAERQAQEMSQPPGFGGPAAGLGMMGMNFALAEVQRIAERNAATGPRSIDNARRGFAPSDSLSSIGNFLGSIQVQQQQLAETRALRQSVVNIERAVDMARAQAGNGMMRWMGW